MTGYGRNSTTNNMMQITVRVRVVNSRFLDLKVRGTELDPELDMKVRDRISTVLNRGNVQIHIDVTPIQGGGLLVFNRKKFEAIDKQLLEIQKEYGQHIAMSDLISYRDIFNESISEQLNSSDVLSALEGALNQTNDMRINEGEKLQKDFESRCKCLDELINQIEKLSEGASLERKDSYLKKIKELMDKVQIDETRLYQEIAIIAERTDITEELVRFRSHIEQFKTLLSSNEPVGKRLNFLLQEMVREINTIGSKNIDSQVTPLVIEVKSEVEKLREQVQNIL